ncbi:MAG TPA: hypothetical protein VG650_06500 [Mycobacteriales bacterium]|nr:hypothetical protein [Mycobacteriales bacterium]
MSTATLEEGTAAPRRSPSTRSRNDARTRSSEPALGLVVTDVARDTLDGLRAVVPAALLRPTIAVDYVFDLVEQAVSIGRRTSREVASIVEAAIEAAETRAAA